MQGSCLCGKIKFVVGLFVPHTTNCYCSMCRKFHGSAFASYGVVPLKQFKLLSGESLLRKYKAKNGTIRSFCGNCGSSLFFQSKESKENIDIALGIMDDEPEVYPEANIYTSSKAAWVQIYNDLPSYEEGHNLP